jgi:hypothetical protein
MHAGERRGRTVRRLDCPLLLLLLLFLLVACSGKQQ